jgi:hypothetical protein
MLAVVLRGVPRGRPTGRTTRSASQGVEPSAMIRERILGEWGTMGLVVLGLAIALLI